MDTDYLIKLICVYPLNPRSSAFHFLGESTIVHSMETTPPSPDDTTGRNSNRPWLFPLLLSMVLFGILLLSPWARHAPLGDAVPDVTQGTPTPQPTGETVGLEIDFGNGAKRQFDGLPWHEEMTVADVLAAARQFHPGIRFSQIGTGESGLLTEIEGLKNEGSTGRNWLYEVADKPGTVSFCLQKVAPGELVRWRFTDASEEQ